MTYPVQKRYSLDDASQYILDKTGFRRSSSGLLQLAKQSELKISFSLPNRDLSFIRLDESGNRWHPKAYFSETAEEPVYVVLPFDFPKQFFNEQLIINPEDDKVFPILGRLALSEFLASMENHTARIHPKKCNAFDDEGNVIEVAIVEQKWIPKSKEFNQWQDTVNFPREASGGALKNEMYFEATDSLLINRSDLFLSRLELEKYINTLIERKNPNEVNRIETWDGVVFYPFEAAAKAMAEKEYPRAKSFFDNHGYDDKNTDSLCDKEMAILMLASQWKTDLEKAIREGVLLQYSSFGRRRDSGYFNEDERLKEVDINDWLKSIGRDFKLSFKQMGTKLITDTEREIISSKPKRKNVSQLHTFIRKVDLALASERIKPATQTVWNEIEKNHEKYDDEAIIQEVKDNTIFWKSKGGKEQTLLMTSFMTTLSTIRNKH